MAFSPWLNEKWLLAMLTAWADRQVMGHLERVLPGELAHPAVLHLSSHSVVGRRVIHSASTQAIISIVALAGLCAS
nr:hypothetical protein [Rhodoferax sp.]